MDVRNLWGQRYLSHVSLRIYPPPMLAFVAIKDTLPVGAVFRIRAVALVPTPPSDNTAQTSPFLRRQDWLNGGLTTLIALKIYQSTSEHTHWLKVVFDGV